MNKRVLSILLIIALLMAIGIKENIFAKSNKNFASESLLLEVADSIIKANKEYYDIKNVDIHDVVETKKEDGGSYIEYFVEITGCLKYQDATELPQVQGMINALNINESGITTEKFIQKLNSNEFLNDYSNSIKNNTYNMQKDDVKNNAIILADKDNLTADNTLEIAKYVAEKSISFVQNIENEYIGSNSTFNAGLKIEIDENGNILDIQYMIAEGYTRDISLILPKSTQEMIQLGQAQIEKYLDFANEKTMSKNENVTSNNDFVYMRVDAKNYANTYTSNASSRTCTNSSCTNYGGTIRQNVSKYNSEYTWYCCNDCANYVSQAMEYGGVETDSTWCPESLAWINCGNLKKYFVQTTNYWTESDFASCNAGGIILLNNSRGPYHAMMNVQNDTINRAYSAHTNDRLKLAYSSSNALGSNVSYYVFDNVYPEH